MLLLRIYENPRNIVSLSISVLRTRHVLMSVRLLFVFHCPVFHSPCARTPQLRNGALADLESSREQERTDSSYCVRIRVAAAFQSRSYTRPTTYHAMAHTRPEEVAAGPIAELMEVLCSPQCREFKTFHHDYNGRRVSRR